MLEAVRNATLPRWSKSRSSAPLGALAPQLAALNCTFLNVVELTVREVLDGNVQHVCQAAPLDPNASATPTTAQIVAMRDDLLDGHKALLPPGLAR